MSIVIKYVDLELRSAELFSRVARKGFVMPEDRQAVKDIFVEYMANTRALMEEQLHSATVSFFDARTLIDNPCVRHDLCLSYVHYEILEAQNQDPVAVQFNLVLDSFKQGASDLSRGLMELSCNDDFIDVLACSPAHLDLAKRLMAYGEEKAAKPQDSAVVPPRIPAIDEMAAGYSARLLERLYTLLTAKNLPRPAL